MFQSLPRCPSRNSFLFSLLPIEYNFEGRELPHVPVCLDFKNSKLYINDHPGLGAELDMTKLTQVMEVTKCDTNRAQTYFRLDGSITNW